MTLKTKIPALYGPWDGEQMEFGFAIEGAIRVTLPGSSTLYVYRFWQTPIGPQFIYERCYRPATQGAKQ